MARWPKKEKVEESSVNSEIKDTPPILPIETFYALYSNFRFSYPVVDDEGKQVWQTNHQTGNPLYDVDGNKVPIIKTEKFKTLRDKMSRGFLSSASFDPNSEDKQELARGKALKDLAAQRDIQVYTESEHDKMENYDKWVEKQGRLEAEKKIADLETKASRVDALEKRLAELEGK
jgi:hypothetical protein